MPKFSIARKINLGKYGLAYEAIDIGVEGCESFEEAETLIAEERQKIHEAFTATGKSRLETLNNKPQLTYSEEKERETIKISLEDLPF